MKVNSDTDPIRYIHTEEAHNLKAPLKVVPILIDLFNPRSVLDVGCGIGTWIKCFTDLGISDIYGLDGDYVDRTLLERNMSTKRFIEADLTKSFDLGKKFDLVISLEVAEHLPANSAEEFVHCLTKHGETIVFSAAIPNQGGQNHLNEQWKKYWVSLFLKYGYLVYDLIRPSIWEMQDVDYWYKQNILVFSKLDFSSLESKQKPILETIHPEMFTYKFEWFMDYAKKLHEQIAFLENKILNSRGG